MWSIILAFLKVNGIGNCSMTAAIVEKPSVVNNSMKTDMKISPTLISS